MDPLLLLSGKHDCTNVGPLDGAKQSIAAERQLHAIHSVTLTKVLRSL
jgi:hypothetical protein